MLSFFLSMFFKCKSVCAKVLLFSCLIMYGLMYLLISISNC